MAGIIDYARSKIKQTANNLFGDTNPNQAGNQNFFTNTANKVMNTKFVPGQQRTFGQIGQDIRTNPSKYILSSSMTKPNFTGIKPIDKYVSKPTGHAANQLIGFSSLGLVNPPEQQATTVQDRIGQGVGAVAGLINPYSLGAKALGPLGVAGEKVAARIAPKALSKAPQLAQSLVKGVGGEVAQSLGYVGAKKALGQDISFKDDLAAGLLMRGGVGTIAKGLKGYSPKSFDVHPDDIAVMDDFIRRVRGGGANSNLGRAGKDAQRLAEHYVGKSAKDLSNKKLAQVFESLINKAEGQPTKFPALGLVGKSDIGGSKPLKVFRGEGGKNVASQINSYGRGGKYYSLDENYAKSFGKVKAGQVTFKNPLEVTSQADLENATNQMVKSGHTDLSQWAKSKGYDGIVDRTTNTVVDLTKLKGVANAGLGDIGVKAKPITKEAIKLSDAIDHPDLFKKYPEFQNIDFRLTNSKTGIRSGGAGGAYYPGGNGRIEIGKEGWDLVNGKKQLNKTGISRLFHELEHAKQTKTGVSLAPDERELAAFKAQSKYGERYSPKSIQQTEEPLGQKQLQIEQKKLQSSASTPIMPQSGLTKNDIINESSGGIVDARLIGNKEPLPWETNVDTSKLSAGKTQIQQGSEVIQKRLQTPRDLLNKKMQGASGQPMSQQQGIGGLQPKQGGQKPLQQTPRSTFDDIVDKSDIDVKKKVHLFNYLDTPEYVLEKVGLKSYADDLVKADDMYAKNLKTEINRVSQWAKQAPSKESSQKIFQWLDGDKSVQLDPTEARIAGEIKPYLKQWADKLKLPEDKRIAEYITHIFDKDFIQKEFDQDLAKILDENVSKSVYDPFLQKRLGKLGYKEDVWAALDAYVKRATRKEAFDPVLEGLSNRAQNLDLETYKYIQKYVSSINMKPTEVENLLDNFIKQSPVGYSFGQRPTIDLTTKLRTSVFRGALGLNVGSAVRNLSQWGNTYAKLGEKHTVIGYSKLFSKLAKRDLSELYDQNILGDNIVQDRTLAATKQAVQKMDKGLFFLFDLAEKINRGSAYFGAKSKALSQGMDEARAIEFAKKIVRETQFDYSRVGTPVAFRGTIAKTVGQFMTYPLKQKEFLGRMISNKEYAGILRYTAASLITMATFGKLIGMKPTEFIPFAEYFTGEGRFETPVVQLGKGALGMVSTDQEKREEAKKNFWKNAALTFPAGVQIKKTVEGLQATGRGYGQSPSGRVRYPLPQDPASRAKSALFGQYPFKEAQDYFKGVKAKVKQPLGEKQSEVFKNLQGDQKTDYYNSVQEGRDMKRENKRKLESGLFGLDIPNPFAKKEEPKGKISDIIMWTDENGRSTTVKLSAKENNAKKGSLESYEKDDDNASKAIKIWKAPTDQVSNAQKIAAYKQLGYSADDVRYAYKADFDNDTKTEYIKGLKLEHDELIRRLETGRVKSLGDKYFASDGVLDNLAREGLITYAERGHLKKIKLDKDGKPLAGTGTGSGGGKGKKGRKLRIGRISVPKPKGYKQVRIKLQRPKFGKVRLKTKTVKSPDSLQLPS